MLSTVRRRALGGIRSSWARNAPLSSVYRPQLASSFWSKKEDPDARDNATDKQKPPLDSKHSEEGSGDGSMKKQDGKTADMSSEIGRFDQYVDQKVLNAAQQRLSSLWTKKEDPKKDDAKNSSNKDKTDEEESTYSRIFNLWNSFPMSVALLGIGGIIAVFGFTDKASKEFVFNEQECEAKVLADAAPGTHPGSNHIKRVKMSHRLSIDDLVRNGVGHAELEGTLWTCNNANSFSYPEKVYQQKYWNDEAAYELTPEAAEKLRLATEELHAMCLEAVDTVVASDDLLTLFEIPPNMWEEVRRSWRTRERDFLGRFDFMWDGRGEPKLAEYNADTPTILVETAVGQTMWSTLMHQHHPNGFGWTFNALEQQIINALSGFLVLFMSAAEKDRSSSSTTTVSRVMDKIHFAGVYESVEEAEHLRYLARLARVAGFTTRLVDMADLDVVMGRVIDTKSQKGSISTTADVDGYEAIETIFKLYPYEWLAHESVGREAFRESNIISGNAEETASGWPRTRWIEPAWKLILGNKAILAVLWQRFPGHRNLLPAYFELPDEATSSESGFNDNTTATNDQSMGHARGISYVAKPKFGREGQGIVYGHKYTYASDFVTAAEQQIYSGYTATTSESPSSSSSSSSSSSTGGHDNDVYLGYPVYQQYFETATFSMRHIVIGSWVVAGVPSGFNFREDSTATTQDSSCFVPHYITGASRQEAFTTVHGSGFNAVQKQLYKDLYGVELANEVPPASSSASSGGHHSHRSAGGGSGSGSGGWGFFRDHKEVQEMKDREEKEKKEKEEKEKKDREEREKKQGKDKDKDKDHQNKQDTKHDRQDPAQKAKDTSNKATAERFRNKRSQAGGHPAHHPHHPHHHPHSSRATGSSYKAAKASAGRGGSGRGG